MDVITVNHSQVLSSALHKKPQDIEIVTTPQSDSAIVNSASPSAIVSLSDEGLSISQDTSPAPAIEKSDAEYQSMSYEQLIAERDGTFIHSGNLSYRFVNETGKASQYAAIKLADQMRLNSDSAVAVRQSLDDFKSKASSEISGLNSTDYDVSFKDGKPAIVSSTLSSEIKIKLEALLNSNNKFSTDLKNSINTFNDAGLKLINMRMADEKSKFEGSENTYAHRNSPLTMKEFTDSISYFRVGASEGASTYNKYSEIIGSTIFGNVYIEKK